MDIKVNEQIINTMFQVPDNNGAYPPALEEWFQDLASRRRSVILVFPPKSAGTFLREAASIATGGTVVRVVHAQGGRDAQPYLPTFVMYFLGGMSEGPLVTHIHMQALPANKHFVETFDLQPVIMVRSIPDMLASYRDMLDTDPVARADGLNCAIPSNYLELSEEAKCAFLVDILGPWYANYYATWLAYEYADPDRVCLLTYDELVADAAGTLKKVLDHSRIKTSLEDCTRAIAQCWDEKQRYRFNRGEAGRGRAIFSADQIARLERMLSYYPSISAEQRTMLLA